MTVKPVLQSDPAAMTRIVGDLAGMPVCSRPATASQRRPAGAAHAFRLCTAPLLGPSHRHHYAGEVSTGGSGAGARRPAGPYQPCTEAHLIHRRLDPDPAGRPTAAEILRVDPSASRRLSCPRLVTAISSRPSVSPIEPQGVYGLSSAADLGPPPRGQQGKAGTDVGLRPAAAAGGLP